MKQKLIIANLKMNPSTSEECLDLFNYYQKTAERLKNVDFVIAPPFIYLKDLIEKGAVAAAQDCFYEEAGAYTGEISTLMLKNVGVKYVILGHSERRQMGETDEMINKKLQAVLRNGLIPILCVGETKEERDSGKKEEVIRRQIIKAFNNFKLLTFNFELVIAYEPVWAIGTGLACNPKEANKTHQFIQNILVSDLGFGISDFQIVYGGSVDSQNIGEFLKEPIIDGALVGGASLKKEEFAKILAIADSL